MRNATRSRVPVVAVQTDPRSTAPLAYVPRSAVVVCPPGSGFPVDEITRVLVRELGSDAVSLAARVPALRNAVVAELVRRASVRAAVVGALPWRKGADFSALALIQARLVLDVAAAHGSHIDRERAPELAAVAGAGLGAARARPPVSGASPACRRLHRLRRHACSRRGGHSTLRRRRIGDPLRRRPAARAGASSAEGRFIRP